MTHRHAIVEALEPRRLLAAFDVVGETILKDGEPFVPLGSNYNGQTWYHGDGAALTKDLVNVSKNAWKFNTIRVNNLMDASNAKNGRDTYDNNDDLDAIINAYTSADMVVMLELHDWTGSYPTGSDYADALDWWEQTARDYKDNDHVWFNIMNEPGGSGQVSTQWRDFHRDAIERIRDAADADNIIVIDGAAWGQEVGEWGTGDPTVDTEKSGILRYGNEVKRFGGKTYDDIVFSLHLYDQWGQGSDSFNKNKLRDYVDRVRAEGHALIFGEVGVEDWKSTDSLNAKALRAAYDVAAEKDIGVLSWSFNQYDTFNHVQGKLSYQLGSDWNNPQGLSYMGDIVWEHTHNYEPPTSYQRPYGSSIPSITSQINAERYDRGGQGLAYHDTTIENKGSSGFRESERVDIGGGNGNYNVGWIADGEWLEYTVNVPSTGAYDLEFRLASPNSTGRFEIRVGEDAVGQMNVPVTGSWSTYWTVKLSDVQLDAGPEMKLRLDVTGGDFNLDWIKATKLQNVFADGNVIRLENAQQNDYLDADFWTDNGTQINRVDLDNDAGTDTAWILRDRGNGWFRLESQRYNGMFLDADMWSGTNKADLRDSTGGSDIEWRFISHNGHYALESRQYQGQYLDYDDEDGSIDLADNYVGIDKQWRVTLA